MNKPSIITSLWALVESMQTDLESQGYDHEVIDAAVTCGLESMLRTRSAERDAVPSLVNILAAPAQA